MTVGSHEPKDLNDRSLRDRTVAAARGDLPFDLLIHGGILVDMVTGEHRRADIGIVGPLIASVHEPDALSEAVERIDAASTFIVPGLIDTHMHIESSMVTPSTYARTVLPKGVTTIVWDPHEFGNVSGLDGVRWAIEASRALPLRVLPLAPSCVPSAPGLELAGADFGPRELEEMLAWPEIGGVAEVMNMRGVIDRDPRMTGIVQAGLDSGKLVCGHARGLAGADLNAFQAAGIASDHELISAEDLTAKIRAGLTIELRGSHDHLLPEFVAALNKLGHLPQTVTLCTDDVFPDDLHENGGLDDVVRRLVAYGLRPEWALQAATLNAARHLGRRDLGLVATGRRADLVLFEDLQNFKARHVLTNGQRIASAGMMKVEVPEYPADRLRRTMKLEPLTEKDFQIPTQGHKVRIATIDRPRFTRWGDIVAEVQDGFVVPPDGTAYIAVAHRHGRRPSVPRVGLLTGWGTWTGAFCTTVSHDSHNLTVFGGNPQDMSIAANAVIAAGGGMAVASEGKLDAVLPLPLAGLVSDAEMARVAEGFKDIRSAVGRIATWQPPYLVFKACFGATLACNAGPHQTDCGIADVLENRVLETPVLEILA
jgi:Adenine deaminase